MTTPDPSPTLPVLAFDIIACAIIWRAGFARWVLTIETDDLVAALEWTGPRSHPEDSLNKRVGARGLAVDQHGRVLSISLLPGDGSFLDRASFSARVRVAHDYAAADGCFGPLRSALRTVAAEATN